MGIVRTMSKTAECSHGSFVAAKHRILEKVKARKATGKCEGMEDYMKNS